jgi:hypothetical protein
MRKKVLTKMQSNRYLTVNLQSITLTVDWKEDIFKKETIRCCSEIQKKLAQRNISFSTMLRDSTKGHFLLDHEAFPLGLVDTA